MIIFITLDLDDMLSEFTNLHTRFKSRRGIFGMLDLDGSMTHGTSLWRRYAYCQPSLRNTRAIPRFIFLIYI
jgi:hypothetical protein